MALIAIDGPTGVGKSTTARAVAVALHADAALDPVSVSPLLDDYYTGDATPAAALGAELSFLHARADLLTGEHPGLTVADFSVMRTAPFAEFLDDPADRAEVLRQMYVRLQACRRIDVLVLLHAPPDTLLRRVRARDRDAEGDLTIEHLRALSTHFRAWRGQMLTQGRNVIELDTARWDPRSDAAVSNLVDRIAVRIGAPDS